MSQDTYIDKILKWFNMQDSKKGFLLMSHGITLSKTQCPATPDEQERMREIPYASAIGSIMYAMLCTCPDVSYALSVTSRYQSNFSETHWTTVKSILMYLRRTKDVFLVFGGEDELIVKGYTDASFQKDKDDSRSQSGFVFCLNGGGSELEKFQARDSSRFNDRVRVYCTSEAAKVVWIGKFVSVLGVVPSASSPVDLYCDNSGTIAQAKEPRSRQKSK